MLKIFLLSFIVISSLFAIKEIQPTFIYKASGGVTDIISENNKLYVSTQSSKVDIFDLKTKKLINSIDIPKIKDFMGDIVDAKVYNIDVLDNDIILTVQASSGFRELYIYKDNKLVKLINDKQKLYISKALFVDKNHIVFCLLGNTMKYYDIKAKKILWSLEVKAPDADFNSTFSDFALNEIKSLAVVADESGDLKIVDIKKKKVIDILAGRNLDKVFKVDFKNNKIITAGQDGKCVLYNLKNNTDYFLRETPNWFLIYGAGLSPNGKYGAYSSDENNNVTIFDTYTKTKLYKLKNNLMTLTSILFINDEEVFIGTDSNKFNYYKIGE